MLFHVLQLTAMCGFFGNTGVLFKHGKTFYL